MATLLQAFKPAHLKRYRDLAWLLVRHGRRDIAERAGLAEYVESQDAPLEESSRAEQLTSDLERLGPTFIKLGQLLSTRADMLPPDYLEALCRLQDKVEPFPFEQAREIVERELGTKISKAFETFEETPVASASLGQVHRAVLHSGRKVAVKVQRPGIEEEIIRDFDALAPVADFMDKHTELGAKYEFSLLIQDLRKSVLRELNYREEARNLTIMGENLAEHPRLVVPAPVDEYTTARVLTMDYVQGRKITTLSPLVFSEVKGDELIEDLFNAYLDQVLVHGFFHADPHPGNVFLLGHGEAIALIDMGLVCHVTPAASESILKLLLALTNGEGEEAAGYALDISVQKKDFDRDGFIQAFTEITFQTQNVAMGDQKFGAIFLGMQQAAAEHGVRLARELRYLGKTILNLESIGEALARDLSPQDAIAKRAAKVMRSNMFDSMKPSQLLKQAAEMKEMAVRFPRRVNQILEMLTRNDLAIRIDAIDEDRLMVGFQKVANRITVGLVLAAMIVAAAMMMDMEARYSIAGYPALAILLFVFAVFLGGSLVVNIMWNDIYDGRRRR